MNEHDEAARKEEDAYHVACVAHGGEGEVVLVRAHRVDRGVARNEGAAGTDYLRSQQQGLLKERTPTRGTPTRGGGPCVDLS